MRRNTSEASTGAQRRDPIEPKPRKPRCYKQRFGGFCPMCEVWFTAATSKKKTCSELCKSRLKRQRRKVAKTEEQILWALGDLQKMIQTPDKVQKKKAKATLLNIYQQVLMTCQEVGLKPCQP